MAMEDKNSPVQPDAVEATETRGRKVGAARFFELLGRDLWPFYKASILCVLGFAPGYAAVLFSTMAASLPLCLLSGAVGGLIAAPVFAACWIPSCALCAMNPATGGTPTAWPGSRTGAKVCCPVPGRGFALGCGPFCCTPCLIWKTCLSRYGSAWCLASSFAGVLPVSVCAGGSGQRVPGGAAEKRRAVHDRILPRTLAAGAVLCIYWGVMLAWMPYTIPVVLILGFWLPCTLALQIIYPALDKAFHLEKTIIARREDEINDLMEQHGHTSV